MPDDSPTPPSERPATFTAASIIVGPCPHCKVVISPHVVGGRGMPYGETERACLQCIADGCTCCSLDPLARR